MLLGDKAGVLTHTRQTKRSHALYPHVMSQKETPDSANQETYIRLISHTCNQATTTIQKTIKLCNKKTLPHIKKPTFIPLFENEAESGPD